MTGRQTDQPASPGIKRRTIAKGAAWTVPVVSLAAAAPAYAASEPVTVVPCGVACKHPGNANSKTYHFTFCFSTNSELVGGVVHLDGMTVNGVRRSVSPTTVSVSPGAGDCYYVDASGFGNSANGMGTLSYHYTVVGDERVDATVMTNANSLPTCGSGHAASEPHNYPHPGASPSVNCL
jgi:hypothetical protein